MKKAGFLVGTTIMMVCLLLSPVNSHSAIVDLRTVGSEGTINDAIFLQADPQATGSGVINSFVRISDNTDVVEGYNTSGRPVPYDENTSPIFTHDLLLTDVPTFNIGGKFYREFILDNNQTGSAPLISLDEIEIYLGGTGGLTTTTRSALGDLVWSLDNSGDNDILLDYSLNSGSGSGDMFMYIPNSLFAALSDEGSNFVYLYSKFGEYGPDFVNNDGYEEWAVRKGTSAVPLPASIILLASGLFGLVGCRRKLKI